MKNWQEELRALFEESILIPGTISRQERVIKILEQFISQLLEEQKGEIIRELESNPNEDGSISPNIQHWIERKQAQLRKLDSLK